MQETRLEPDDRSHVAGMAARELQRDVAAVAAPDDHGRRRVKCVEERRRVVRLLLASRSEERLGRSLRLQPRRSKRISRPSRESGSTAPAHKTIDELPLPWIPRIGVPSPCSS